MGKFLVMDWGLAKILREEEAPGDRIEGFEEAVNLTQSAGPVTLEGRIMGTPNFMAPEQAAGQVSEVDERTDIYALGATLYDILTLRPPILGENVSAHENGPACAHQK